MTIFYSVIAFIIIFSLLILIHEVGHFWMAKKAGVRVDEFGFGLPPRMIGKKYKGTLYSLNWIPFGGFVRLYGEDPKEKGALNSSESFISKTSWQKTKIVLGGVFMNFLLAWVLFTIVFTVGIKPLVVDFEQFDGLVKEGSVNLNPYHVVKSYTGENPSILQGHRLVAVNDEPVTNEYALPEEFEGNEVSLTFRSSMYKGDFETARIYDYGFGYAQEVIKVSPSDFEKIEFYDRASITRVRVANDSVLGLKKGDLILDVDGKEVLSAEHFLEILQAGPVVRIQVLRGDALWPLKPDTSFVNTYIKEVLADTPAFKAGILADDIIVSIDGEKVYTPTQVQEVTTKNSVDNKLSVEVKRGDELLKFDVDTVEGRIGVALGQSLLLNDLDLVLRDEFSYASIISIKEINETFYRAPIVAFKEMVRLSVMSFEMIGQMVKNIVSKGEVPSEVAGPVGIAQMTYFSVQSGLIELLRFAGLLSLSLGVLNILPFPALDGGRFVFILIESIFGKAVNQKFEASLHTMGFLLLMLLIVAITWNDIVRIVG